MRALSTDLRRQLETAVVEGRRAAETGVRAALESLGVAQHDKPSHLNDEQARLRRGLRAKQRQLGGEFEVLVLDAAYEQWHRLLFARFLAENELLRHPQYGVPVTLADCEELAEEMEEPDAWSVAARFAAEILPGIFRLRDPCVQLRLAPEHRVALKRIVADLPAEVFTAEDSLGWVYQYWQSERKNQVNASEAKIGGANLGPVTQLFTENYMVRFLLENSLGAWWAARHPDSPLVKEFEFLRFGDDGEPAAGSFEGWPNTVAEVTVMDPCCGSGHFLVEAFGMLWRMRSEEDGLDSVAAQDAVLTDNLFGLELDPRCVQIAMFAVALAAWKQGGEWRRLPTPNIACSGIPAKAPLNEWTDLAKGDEGVERALEQRHLLFEDADTLGSLIDPRRVSESPLASGMKWSFYDMDFERVAPLLERVAARETGDPATAVLGADAAAIARVANLLSRHYTLIATNVPYLSSGRQSPKLQAFLDRFLEAGSPDLATAFIERFLATAGVVAMVSPQSWQQQQMYEDFRRLIVTRYRYRVMARLGNDVWQRAGSGNPFKLHTVLSILGSEGDEASGSIVALDVGTVPFAARASSLATAGLMWLEQRAQLDNPECRIVMAEPSGTPLLETVAECYQGLATADFGRFGRHFWEQPLDEGVWCRLQSSVTSVRPYGGRESVVRWDSGAGPLVESPSARVQGMSAWGHYGIAVSQMGDLKATLYTGEMFDNNVAAMIPHEPGVLPALWAFCSSRDYSRLVRQVNSRPGVTNRDLLKVAFDEERWRRVAAEEFPDGLPEPWSDDPTQWLFEGRPEVATKPLQVGVGRLVGYRWPEQPESDDLDELSDDDGIVCLPAVGGELPAADRLTALLSKAYGDQWSPSLARELLEQAGSKKALADWLRDEFFKHHCRVFSERPFVWHVTDGRKDGFSALVNYHALDRAGLEKLTYTYLGDWVERQRADAAEDVGGADVRLAAARDLKSRLEQILDGEPPYDIYVRWKPLHEQPIGWEPDLDDGVRLNIRPFVNAGVLAGPSSVPRVSWKKDRGRDPDGSERKNDRHPTIAQKQHARLKQ